MITVLILLAVALIICLAFMGITTWMYLNLEKDFQKQKLAMQSFITQFDLFCTDLEEQRHKAAAILEDAEEVNRKAELQMSSVTNTANKANDAADFAMKTVQEVRKMLRPDKTAGQRIIYVNGKPAEIRSTASPSASPSPTAITGKEEGEKTE